MVHLFISQNFLVLESKVETDCKLNSSLLLAILFAILFTFLRLSIQSAYSPPILALCFGRACDRSIMADRTVKDSATSQAHRSYRGDMRAPRLTYKTRRRPGAPCTQHFSLPHTKDIPALLLWAVSKASKAM